MDSTDNTNVSDKIDSGLSTASSSKESTSSTPDVGMPNYDPSVIWGNEKYDDIPIPTEANSKAKDEIKIVPVWGLLRATATEDRRVKGDEYRIPIKRPN
ncbi:hypothetical protein QYM36_019120 [Artemia franciscana]|uniref:Uncharacterized protein n=1 Tax=Artemia franciscana TaxID=6661 RepID=A0AA88H5P6_ARTSF|nr:hypothetical protein QYM36_019120 [Artemia franciscana]